MPMLICGFWKGSSLYILRTEFNRAVGKQLLGYFQGFSGNIYNIFSLFKPLSKPLHRQVLG